MLSTSYRLFLVMDQLRRKAGISAQQLTSVLEIAPSSYSRISKNVYGCCKGSLNAETDYSVQRATAILVSGFVTKVLHQSSIKQPDTISDVLTTIANDMADVDQDVTIDADLSELISAAQRLIT